MDGHSKEFSFFLNHGLNIFIDSNSNIVSCTIFFNYFLDESSIFNRGFILTCFFKMIHKFLIFTLLIYSNKFIQSFLKLKFIVVHQIVAYIFEYVNACAFFKPYFFKKIRFFKLKSRFSLLISKSFGIHCSCCFGNFRILGSSLSSIEFVKFRSQIIFRNRRSIDCRQIISIFFIFLNISIFIREYLLNLAVYTLHQNIVLSFIHICRNLSSTFIHFTLII